MSTPTTKQGKNVPLAISTDNITYKNLVCSTAHDGTLDKPVNTEQSDCGSHSSLGNETVSMTFSGLINTTPNGATEAGFDELLGYFDNETKIYLKTIPQTKTITAYGWISNLTYTKATESLMAYSFTFTGDGGPTITP